MRPIAKTIFGLTALGALLGAYLIGARTSQSPPVTASPVTEESPVAEARALPRPEARVPGFVVAAAPPERESEPAPAARALTAAEERDDKLSWLRQTGQDHQNLLAPAQAAGEAWQALARKLGMQVEFQSWECHSAGCAASVIHRAEATVDELAREISHSDEFNKWNGPKMRTGPVERTDGAVEVSWILYAPDVERHASNQTQTEKRSVTQ